MRLCCCSAVARGARGGGGQGRRGGGCLSVTTELFVEVGKLFVLPRACSCVPVLQLQRQVWSGSGCHVYLAQLHLAHQAIHIRIIF